jgi:hypothetical protein
MSSITIYLQCKWDPTPMLRILYPIEGIKSLYRPWSSIHLTIMQVSSFLLRSRQTSSPGTREPPKSLFKLVKAQRLATVLSLSLSLSLSSLSVTDFCTHPLQFLRLYYPFLHYRKLRRPEVRIVASCDVLSVESTIPPACSVHLQVYVLKAQWDYSLPPNYIHLWVFVVCMCDYLKFIRFFK